MVLMSWVMLLLLPVGLRADSKKEYKQEDLKPARYTLTHLSNGHLAFKVKEESPRELPNWQADSVPQKLNMLKLELGTESFQKCLNLLNPISTTSPTDSLLEIGMQLEKNLDFKFCAMREKWNQLVPEAERTYLKTRRFSDSFDYYDKLFKFDRQVDPNLNKNFDCLHHSRKFVRPFPGNCYWKPIAKPADKEFWKFWNQIGVDLMYTYDFVLYDSVFQERKENQIWYLIAYLRIIASHITNPHIIVNYYNERKIINIMNKYKMSVSLLAAELMVALGLRATLAETGG